MFAVRIVKVDYYLSVPKRHLDECYSDFRGRQLSKVPVVRIFGSTPAGQKTCLHLHGVYPYICVPYDGTQPIDRYMYQLAVALDHALSSNQLNRDTGVEHVHRIELVTGIPFYGYYAKEQQFLKIYFLNPQVVERAVDLLQSGAILNRSFQPYEAHLPFILQMFIDNNLHGMNLIKLKRVTFRREEISFVLNKNKVSQSSSESVVSPIVGSLSASDDLSGHVWDPGTLSKNYFSEADVSKVSNCELEVDSSVTDILNSAEVSGLQMNPGIEFVWEDERRRRRFANESSQCTPPASQDRPVCASTKSEVFFLEKLKEKLEALRKRSVIGDDSFSDVSQVHEKSGVEASPGSSHLPAKESSEEGGVAGKSEDFAVGLRRLSQVSFNEEDREVLDLLLEMAETNLASEDADRCRPLSPLYTKDDKVEKRDQLNMSQAVWDFDSDNEEVANGNDSDSDSGFRRSPEEHRILQVDGTDDTLLDRPRTRLRATWQSESGSEEIVPPSSEVRARRRLLRRICSSGSEDSLQEFRNPRVGSLRRRPPDVEIKPENPKVHLKKCFVSLERIRVCHDSDEPVSDVGAAARHVKCVNGAIRSPKTTTEDANQLTDDEFEQSVAERVKRLSSKKKSNSPATSEEQEAESCSKLQALRSIFGKRLGISRVATAKRKSVAAQQDDEEEKPTSCSDSSVICLTEVTDEVPRRNGLRKSVSRSASGDENGLGNKRMRTRSVMGLGSSNSDSASVMSGERSPKSDLIGGGGGARLGIDVATATPCNVPTSSSSDSLLALRNYRRKRLCLQKRGADSDSQDASNELSSSSLTTIASVVPVTHTSMCIRGRVYAVPVDLVSRGHMRKIGQEIVVVRRLADDVVANSKKSCNDQDDTGMVASNGDADSEVCNLEGRVVVQTKAEELEKPANSSDDCVSGEVATSSEPEVPMPEVTAPREVPECPKSFALSPSFQNLCRTMVEKLSPDILHELARNSVHVSTQENSMTTDEFTHSDDSDAPPREPVVCLRKLDGATVASYLDLTELWPSMSTDIDKLEISGSEHQQPIPKLRLKKNLGQFEILTAVPDSEDDDDGIRSQVEYSAEAAPLSPSAKSSSSLPPSGLCLAVDNEQFTTINREWFYGCASSSVDSRTSKKALLEFSDVKTLSSPEEAVCENHCSPATWDEDASPEFFLTVLATPEDAAPLVVGTDDNTDVFRDVLWNLSLLSPQPKSGAGGATEEETPSPPQCSSPTGSMSPTIAAKSLLDNSECPDDVIESSAVGLCQCWKRCGWTSCCHTVASSGSRWGMAVGPEVAASPATSKFDSVHPETLTASVGGSSSAPDARRLHDSKDLLLLGDSEDDETWKNVLGLHGAAAAAETVDVLTPEDVVFLGTDDLIGVAEVTLSLSEPIEPQLLLLHQDGGVGGVEQDSSQMDSSYPQPGQSTFLSSSMLSSSESSSQIRQEECNSTCYLLSSCSQNETLDTLLPNSNVENVMIDFGDFGGDSGSSSIPCGQRQVLPPPPRPPRSSPVPPQVRHDFSMLKGMITPQMFPDVLPLPPPSLGFSVSECSSNVLPTQPLQDCLDVALLDHRMKVCATNVDLCGQSTNDSLSLTFDTEEVVVTTSTDCGLSSSAMPESLDLDTMLETDLEELRSALVPDSDAGDHQQVAASKSDISSTIQSFYEYESTLLPVSATLDFSGAFQDVPEILPETSGVGAGRSVVGGRLLTYNVRPPSPASVGAFCAANGLATAAYHLDAFCSDPRDAPRKPMQFGDGAVVVRLHSDAPLQEVRSTLSETGLEHWRQVFLIASQSGFCWSNNGAVSLRSSGGQTKYPGSCWEPCRLPPSRDDVTKWLTKVFEASTTGHGGRSPPCPEEPNSSAEFAGFASGVSPITGSGTGRDSGSGVAAAGTSAGFSHSTPDVTKFPPKKLQKLGSQRRNKRTLLPAFDESVETRPQPPDHCPGTELEPLAPLLLDDSVRAVPSSGVSRNGAGRKQREKSSQSPTVVQSLRRKILERRAKIPSPAVVREGGVGSRRTSQLDAPTPRNPHGFKISLDSLQEQPSSANYFLSVLSLEVHVETVGDLRPDPSHNRIGAVFYHVHHDDDGGRRRKSETGIVLPQIGEGEGLENLRTSELPGGDGDGIRVTRVRDELSLIEEFVEIVTRHDPDVLVGYELELSSWGFLIERAGHLGLKLAPALSRVPEDSQNSFRPVQPNSGDGFYLNVIGRIVIGVWQLMRHELSLYNYKFENVAYHVLHRRIPLFTHRSLTQWFGQAHHRWRTVRHYLVRAVGNYELLDRLDVLGRTAELACLFGIQFAEVHTRGSQFRVESMMLRLCRQVRFVAVSPSVQQRAAMRAPECLPLIMEPLSRFYSHPVVVLDFQSLYPSIMIAYNYCFSTCLGRLDNLADGVVGAAFNFGCTSLKTPPGLLANLLDDVTVSPCGVAFVRSSVRKGILPRMLEEILTTRIMVKMAMKRNKDNKNLLRKLDARQLGLKLISNVTYGYTSANFSGRMPCVEIADSVVSKARETLERAVRLVESTARWRGRVVYGDTDSLFVLLEGRSKDEAFAVGQEIVEAVSADNPKPIKLKLEKVYLPCVLQTKKRYVGFKYETPDQREPVYEAKGTETVRRDGCPAVTKILEKSLRILFASRDVSKVRTYVTNQLQKLLAGRVSLDDYIFSREYRGRHGYATETHAPALKIARQFLRMDPRSEPRIQERVPYVVVYGSPGALLIELVHHPYDVLQNASLRLNAKYYISNVVIPSLDRVFSLLGANVRQWYASMPRCTRSHSHDAGTISWYFVSNTCPVCDGPVTSKGVCDSCTADRQAAAVVLATKIRACERRFADISKVCHNCTGTQSSQLSCVSLDCPIFFRLVQASRDVSRTSNLRSLMAKWEDASMQW